MVEIISFFFLSSFFLTVLEFWGLDFVGEFLNCDEFSLSMVMLSIFLAMCISWIVAKSKNKLILNTFMTFLVCCFFFTDSILWFFVFFEMTLIPLIFFIISWGRQPERLNASFSLILYTVCFSVPLFLSSVWLNKENGFFSVLFFREFNLPSLVFLAFFVKIPVFFLHSWLPKAHVEAPLEGSMVLAGIMLKLGVFGLIRFMVFSYCPWILSVGFCIGVVGAVFSAFIALSSDDVKMAVAFSSVSHMNFVFASIMTNKMIASKGALMIMISHGLSSPLLFFLVTLLYKMTNSRSILLGKGVLSKYPLLAFLSFSLWVSNFSAPPLFSFVGEIFCIVSVFSFSELCFFWVFFYIVVMSFFSMVNHSIYSHSAFKNAFPSSENYYFFVLSCFLCVSGLVVLFFNPLICSIFFS